MAITSANETHHICLPPSFTIVGWKVVAWLGHAQQAIIFSFLHCLTFIYCVNLIPHLKPLYLRRRGWNLTMKLSLNLSPTILITTIDYASLNSAISSFSIPLWVVCSASTCWVPLALLDIFSSFFFSYLILSTIFFHYLLSQHSTLLGISMLWPHMN